MTLQEFLGTLENSDRIRIVENGKDIYIGYLVILTIAPDKNIRDLFELYKNAQVKKFRAIPELRHKRWKELNLMSPLTPEKTPDFSFSDMQMTLYYTIHI